MKLKVATCFVNDPFHFAILLAQMFTKKRQETSSSQSTYSFKNFLFFPPNFQNCETWHIKANNVGVKLNCVVHSFQENFQNAL